MAVNKNGWSLLHVKEQTEEICLQAVKESVYALQYAEKQTQKMCLRAVKVCGGLLRYVKEQTEEICLEAINNNYHAMHFLDEESMSNDKILKAATKSLLKLNRNLSLSELDLSKYCIYISKISYYYKYKIVCDNNELNNLEVVDFRLEDGYPFILLNFLIDLNKELKFIVDVELDKDMINKMILSNNGIILTENTKIYYSKYINLYTSKVKKLFNEDEYDIININLDSFNYLKDFLVNQNSGNHFVFGDRINETSLRDIAFSNNELILIDTGYIKHSQKRLANKIIKIN